VQEGANEVKLAIPQVPQAVNTQGELSDDALEGVAGGCN
jgi:hypothetical protein